MTALSRRRLVALAAAGMVASVAARADEAADIRQPISDLYKGLEAGMRAGRSTPFGKRFDALAAVIDRVYDLETVLSVSVGLRWQSMPEATRRQLADVFRRFTIASYVANFDSFDGEKFEIQPTPRPSGKDQIVDSRIIPGSGDPVRMNYIMRRSEAGWRIVDVLLDGTISRVAVQRSDFRALLAKGDAEALIASLQRKVADLSGGTLGS